MGDLIDSSSLFAQTEKSWIFGYGSLMSLDSIRTTMPSVNSFELAILPGYRRIYNLVSISGIRNGAANFLTNEIAALSVVEDVSSTVFGCVFNINTSELASYFEREHRYKRLLVRAITGKSASSNADVTRDCWTVATQTDEEYFRSMPGGNCEWQERVGQYYCGQLWGRVDVLPMRQYMINVISATWNCGNIEWLQNLLDNTVLSDGQTTLRQYITSGRIFNIAQEVPVKLTNIIFETSPQLVKSQTTPTVPRDIDSAINRLDVAGNSPLHTAAYHGNIAEVQRLISAGAEVDIRSRNHETPLTLACSAEHIPVIKYLLEQGANPNARTDGGWTPLHIICENASGRCAEIIKFLIEFGADVKSETDELQKPIDLCSIASVKDILGTSITYKRKFSRMREIAGADDTSNELINCDHGLMSCSGRNVLHDAVLSGNVIAIRTLLSHESNQCLICAADAYGNTPLHYACYHNYGEIIEVLLSQSKYEAVHSSLTMRTSLGESALDFGCLNGHFEVVQLLIPKYVVNVNIADDWGWTALHCACCKPRPRSRDIVEWLLHYGADKSAITEDGDTPASLTNDSGILELLR